MELEQAGGSVVTLGTAEVALRGSKLSPSQKEAVRTMVRAVRYLRERHGLSGVDDAGRAVRLLVGSANADNRGPFAEAGRITVGTRNPVASAAAEDALSRRILPFDVALHELTHVVQFAAMGSNWSRLNPQLAEGMADTVAMLATRDWSIGERYFGRRRGGAYAGTIRSIDPRTRTKGEPVQFDWRAVRDGNVEEHAAGAVVSRTFYEISTRIGWHRAQELVWTVLRDPVAWENGGSWQQLAASIQRSANLLWPSDPAIAAVIGVAMRATHLDEAVPASQELRSLAA